MFTGLSAIANVSLGYKSLQNNFFYLNKATIDTYGIEHKYLTPILMMRDLNGRAYQQTVKSALWLFNCKDSKADLRGTGAHRYIEAMADRAAAEKKQTGITQTIREALEAQSGGVWYAPKARPNRHHVWLRKAFDGVFAPFLFDKPALVDQRCNSVSPLSGIEWNELAAAPTSSLFAYSLEINGSASMGAGALEAPTTKLRSYPVLDINQLKPSARKKLAALAEAVWAKENPLDWSIPGSRPGSNLRALDQWIIDITGRNLKLDVVYDDIYDVCQARIAVANDKVKKTKKKHTDNIGNVAESIAQAIMPKMQIQNFPEDFLIGVPLDIDFNVDRRTFKLINISRLLGSCDIELVTNDGNKVYEATHPASVAEAIVRSLLWGRSIFSVSSNPKAMDHALTQFLKWIAQIEKDIAMAISESALGTGYEDALKREIYTRLGIHPLSGATTLPAQIVFVSQS
jgi:hypothetical protein